MKNGSEMNKTNVNQQYQQNINIIIMGNIFIGR